ncbi:MAG: ABC transporter substrate-binding protein, partial [Solirubrobacteraceae bacterium]|nr:ABC transporter substrate-binding protein [Solirubrobacteraceae bacterium]
DEGFVKAAGVKAAEDSRLTCPCGPAPEDFTAKYKAVNDDKEPSTYSAEGYDAAKILLDGIAAGDTDRPKLLDFVNKYDAEGITKHLKFDATGESSETVIYAFKVDPAGDIVLDTTIK